MTEVAVSEIESEAKETLRLRIKWNVPVPEHGVPISSRIFGVPGTQDTWQFSLYTAVEPDNVFKLSLKLVSRGQSKDEPIVALIHGRCPHIDNMFSYTVHTFIIGQFIMLINKEHFFSPKFKLSWNRLGLSLDLIYMSPPAPDCAAGTEGSILEDAKRFQQSITWKNFRIICKDARVIKTNKVFLIMRSEVFRAMFATDMTEKATNQMTMSEYDKSTVEAFLEFLMTDEVPNMADHATDLYMLADKYKIPKLQRICEDYIAKNITQSNSSRVVALVHQVPSITITRALIGLLN